MNFRKNFLHRFGATFFLGFTILAHGSVSDAQLQKEYGGKILTVRQFYPGYHLHFDATGKLDNPLAPGAWTVDGQVQVKTVSLKDGVVHIVGRRLWLFFDTESKQLRDVGSLPKYDTAMKRFNTKNVDEWAREGGRVEIEVECGVTHPKKTDLIKAMNAVFLAPGEALAGVVPEISGRVTCPNRSWGCGKGLRASSVSRKAYHVRLETCQDRSRQTSRSRRFRNRPVRPDTWQ